MTTAFPQAGDHLRIWRKRRGMSQLDLALDAAISQRHLSFVESGRSRPSREMVLRITERLELPLRERNAVLLAAGYSPTFGERSLDDPAMANARAAIELILNGHEPYPALAVDRHWNLVMANDAVFALLAGVENQALLAAPINVLRLSLHPGGLAPRIANLAQWRGHLLDRLRRQIIASRDDVLVSLHRELAAYPDGSIREGNIPKGDGPAGNLVAGDLPAGDLPARNHASGDRAAGNLPAGHGHERHGQSAATADFGGVLVPLKLSTSTGLLSLLSTTTMFGAPRDVVLSEIAIEAFFPADESTRSLLKQTSGKPSADLGQMQRQGPVNLAR